MARAEDALCGDDLERALVRVGERRAADLCAALSNASTPEEQAEALGEASQGSWFGIPDARTVAAPKCGDDIEAALEARKEVAAAAKAAAPKPSPTKEPAAPTEELVEVSSSCTRTNRNDGTDFWTFTVEVRNAGPRATDIHLEVRVKDEKLPYDDRQQYWTVEETATSVPPGQTVELSVSGPRDADQIGPVSCLYEITSS